MKCDICKENDAVIFLTEVRFNKKNEFHLCIDCAKKKGFSPLKEDFDPEKISLEKIILETDDPYLPPVPYRGKRNEPAYMVEVAKKIAEVKDIDIMEVAKATTDNAKKLFNL